MKKQFLLLAVAICTFTGCDKTNDANDVGDWYNGGITGDYDTFSVNCHFASDWEASIFRMNTAIGNWFSFSPTKGKAGSQQITFKVRSNSRILDFAEVETYSVSSHDDAGTYIVLNAEDYEFTFGGKSITEIDFSKWVGVENIPWSVDMYDVYLPNLETIWLKQGQHIEVEYSGTPTWEIKYK